jgi:hypothetical protein
MPDGVRFHPVQQPVFQARPAPFPPKSGRFQRRLYSGCSIRPISRFDCMTSKRRQTTLRYDSGQCAGRSVMGCRDGADQTTWFRGAPFGEPCEFQRRAAQVERRDLLKRCNGEVIVDDPVQPVAAPVEFLLKRDHSREMCIDALSRAASSAAASWYANRAELSRAVVRLPGVGFRLDQLGKFARGFSSGTGNCFSFGDVELDSRHPTVPFGSVAPSSPTGSPPSGSTPV